METTGMRHIRIGKDISMRWSILTDGAAVPLEGRDLTLELKSPIGKVIILPFQIEGNVLTMTYYGYEQTVVGEYSLTLWENKGKPGQNVVDAIRAFKLVRTSPEEADFIGGDLQVESVDLGTANLEILSGGGATTPGGSPDLSALEMKVNANTASISKINEELGTVKNEQTEQNNRLADHEERLVYTESDLVKVRAEYDGIISELVKSIGHTQKAFVVETGDRAGFIDVDNKRLVRPANSIKAYYFSSSFGSAGGTGIISYRLLVTNTSGMGNMAYMFSGCSELKELDVSNFETSSATNMVNMFHGCSKIKELDVSNFDTSKSSSLGMMFAECSSLTSLDVSNFDTRSANSLRYMFYNCSSLTYLDLSKFDTSTTTLMECMFDGCTALTSLLLGTNFFKTSAVTSIDFSSCAKWTNDTVITSLVSNSYDRAAAGLNTLTIKLHANTKAALTDEQKATITNKGYTIA